MAKKKKENSEDPKPDEKEKDPIKKTKGKGSSRKTPAKNVEASENATGPDKEPVPSDEKQQDLENNNAMSADAVGEANEEVTFDDQPLEEAKEDSSQDNKQESSVDDTPKDSTEESSNEKKEEIKSDNVDESTASPQEDSSIEDKPKPGDLIKKDRPGEPAPVNFDRAKFWGGKDLKDIGTIISVQGPVLDAHFTILMPALFNVLEAYAADGRRVLSEVVEHLPGNIAKCICLHDTSNLQRNDRIWNTGDGITTPLGDELYGRIINVVGESLDNKVLPDFKEYSSTRKPPYEKIFDTKGEPKKESIIETGIKMVDLFFPQIKGGKTGVLGGAGCGKTVIVLELINNIVSKHSGACVFYRNR